MNAIPEVSLTDIAIAPAEPALLAPGSWELGASRWPGETNGSVDFRLILLGQLGASRLPADSQPTARRWLAAEIGPASGPSLCLEYPGDGNNSNGGVAVSVGYYARPAVVSHRSAPRRPCGRAPVGVAEETGEASAVPGVLISILPATQLALVGGLPIVQPSTPAQDETESRTPVVGGAVPSWVATSPDVVVPPPLASPGPARPGAGQPLAASHQLVPARVGSGQRPAASSLPPPPARAEGSTMDASSARASMPQKAEAAAELLPVAPTGDIAQVDRPAGGPPVPNVEHPDDSATSELGAGEDRPRRATPEVSARGDRLPASAVEDVGGGSAEEVRAPRWLGLREGGAVSSVRVELADGRSDQARTETGASLVEVGPEVTGLWSDGARGQPEKETARKPQEPAASKAVEPQGRPVREVVRLAEAAEESEGEGQVIDRAQDKREPGRAAKTEAPEAAGQVALVEPRPERASEVRAVLERHVRGLEAVALLHQLEGGARRALTLSRVTMQLRPPQLGTINIAVESRDGNLSARFQASHPLVAAWLESNVPTLRTHLAEAGLLFGDVNCSMTSDHGERGWAGERPELLWSPPEEQSNGAQGKGELGAIDHRGLADWRA